MNYDYILIGIACISSIMAFIFGVWTIYKTRKEYKRVDSKTNRM